MTSWFENEIIQPGKLPLAVLFLAFVVTFLFIRVSTRMIRAQVKWWPGNVTPGGICSGSGSTRPSSSRRSSIVDMRGDLMLPGV